MEFSFLSGYEMYMQLLFGFTILVGILFVIQSSFKRVEKVKYIYYNDRKNKLSTYKYSKSDEIIGEL